ncbi:hypothetical protein [Bacillus cereus]|uniref:hypothetical protein n=1 Tax=Bacillus TaxID=1386 RepID=UPI003012A3B7
MITVMETWYLKLELKDRAIELMQQMDDLLGPAAHEHPGWAGHASFYQDDSELNKIKVIYPWKSKELHVDLANQEEKLLIEFNQNYCIKPREIHYYHELEVEVEHDHHHHHHHVTK